jgi:hypothetical protein
MADGDDHHDQPPVLDQRYDPVVADTVGPELTLIAAQRFPELSRITARGDALL